MRVELQYRNETRSLQRRERDKYGNLLWNMVSLNMGPRVTITDVVGAEQNVRLDYKDEAALHGNISYYQGRSNPAELIQVLKFFTTYLMQQARKEQDPRKQQFLLFKAVDLARMIVQHSSMSVNAEAEALVLSIFVALANAYGQPFTTYARSEDAVFRLMRRLAVVPRDLPLRVKLGEALVEQTSYIDALVQYQATLHILVHQGELVLRNRGWVVARMGDLFQRLSDISASRLKDARKLRMFIDRYNRDFAEGGHKLPRLQDVSVTHVTRVRQALLGEASRWYLQAGREMHLDRRQRLRAIARAAENLNSLGRSREALTALHEQNGLWARVQESEATLREHQDYLRQLSTAAMRTKRRDLVELANREGTEVAGKLSVIEQRRHAHEQARAMLLG